VRRGVVYDAPLDCKAHPIILCRKQKLKPMIYKYNIRYEQDPVDNYAVLSYTSMDGSEHKKD
jgi:hypothetical protein